ncbi:methyltransferase family protein [Saccharicrinis sp. FJH54]|uniref:methyltransferase family protein n=1 Tax=Saccharicrinis sp. FJH54 TaxID=3344665 RepID=UPI0035D402C9
MNHTLIVFIVISIPMVIVSWHPLQNINSHGFYRFFGWEGIAWLFAVNYHFWFKNPFGLQQLISWFLLGLAAYLVIAGYLVMRNAGKPSEERKDKELFHFEKTTHLIDHGVFKYIRHPLYASLVYLTWGLLLKNITMPLLLIAVAATVFMYITTLFEEKESIKYFGEKYKTYMKKTRRFIPFIL